MATNFRIPFKNAVVAGDLPKTGAGSNAGDPVRNGGLNGVNLWGTGKGVGVTPGSAFGVIALDGDAVIEIAVTKTTKRNDPIYITAAGALTTADAGNTVFGFADEDAATGAKVRVGVRISNAVGA